MDKKTKIAVISIVSIIAILIITGTVWYFVTSKNDKTANTISKINILYENLKSTTSYSFSATLDDNNKTYYAKEDKKAYTNTTYEGANTKYIIKDGNSYLLMDDTKVYYTYRNNETDLNKIENQLENIKDIETNKGKEKIDNKSYEYEEIKGVTDFAMQDTPNIPQGEEAKTRFYFNEDKLVYIKTIIGNNQELLKVNISYNVDSKLFEIPSNYKEI